MNEEIKKYLVHFLKNNEQWKDEWLTDKGIIEYLIETDPIYEEDCGSSRWWMNTFRVVEVGSKLIGFEWATTTGDNNARDMGWEFDPKSICEVEKKIEIKEVITYVKK